MTTLVDAGTLVIIVDDDREARESMADVLAMEGYVVQSVASAEAAEVLLVGGLRPSLVILDLWLPGIGSSAFIRHLRASANAKVPVLVVSGAASVEHTELDADAILRKPFELTTLVRTVDKLVGTGRKRNAPVALPRIRRTRRHRSPT